MEEFFHRVRLQYERASRLIESGQTSELREAFSLFKMLAKQCYSAYQTYTPVQTGAQFMLGKCYENGYGIQKSYPRAIRWYKEAGDNVHKDLENNLDIIGEVQSEALETAFEDCDVDTALEIMLFGKITPESLTCKIEAAESGNVEAQSYLMGIFQSGVRSAGIPEDKEKSAYWAERAAKNGSTNAMEQIGNMYYCGEGMEQDDKKALYWWKKAASQGSAFPARRLGEYYKSRSQYKDAAEWYRYYAGLQIEWRNGRLGWDVGSLTTPGDSSCSCGLY